MSDEFESGFFVREAAWHGKGNVLAEVPNTDEAFAQSGLDWEVAKMPLFFRFDGERRNHQAEEFALVRLTDRSQLGCCKQDYNIYQNFQAFNWCKPLVESGYWHWETAGSLCEGRVCWALLKMDEIEVVKGDVLKRFLLVTWSHTGKTSNIVMPVSIRVVCMNTWRMATREGGGNRAIHASTIVPRMEDIQKLYRSSVDAFENQGKMIDSLLHIPMKEDDLLLYTKALSFPDLDNPELIPNEATFDVLRAFIVEGQASGAGQLTGIQHTAYGAYCAYSEVNEHIMGGARIRDRGESVLFGRAAHRNQKALNLALRWEEVQKEKVPVRKHAAIKNILNK